MEDAENLRNQQHIWKIGHNVGLSQSNEKSKQIFGMLSGDNEADVNLFWETRLSWDNVEKQNNCESQVKCLKGMKNSFHACDTNDSCETPFNLWEL